MVVWCTQDLRRDGCSFMWHQPCQRYKLVFYAQSTSCSVYQSSTTGERVLRFFFLPPFWPLRSLRSKCPVGFFLSIRSFLVRVLCSLRSLWSTCPVFFSLSFKISLFSGTVLPSGREYYIVVVCFYFNGRRLMTHGDDI